jgi:ATP-binding cassette subfamily C protein LapB
MTTQTDAGVPLENLSRHERAMELWQAHFPQGEVRQVVITEVKRTEFPLLWFSEDDSQVLIIRGPLAQGGYNAEDDAGDPIDASATQLVSGFLLQLRTDDESWTQDEDKPQTAADWFNYAVRRHRKIFFEAIIATLVLSTIGMA